MSPASQRSSVDVSSRAATSANRVSSSGAVSVPVSSIVDWATIGPESRPASICISVTPVASSPARMAAGMGDAPRQRGSSDGCRLSAPWRRDCQQLRRHDLAVVGQHKQVGRVAANVLDRARPYAGAPGVRVGTSWWVRPNGDRRVDFLPAGPLGRGAVTTASRSTVGFSRERGNDGHGELAVPRKMVRAWPQAGGHASGANSASSSASSCSCICGPSSARPSSRGSRCRACRSGGRSRAGGRAPAGRRR